MSSWSRTAWALGSSTINSESQGIYQRFFRIRSMSQHCVFGSSRLTRLRVSCAGYPLRSKNNLTRVSFTRPVSQRTER
jgi:hypothetical protein